jgi:glucosyl-3-phosphoglycerate synthase
MDTDNRNPAPHYVWAVLGPLLLDPELQLVKGFYRRPIEVGGVRYPSGGGRVTELCARPLLNSFWPPLSGLVQPLSGEFAARRALLESIPFCTGYGVEIGMLIDVYGAAGLSAIAQADLGERIHTNQPVDALARMAFEVTQAAMRRLARKQRAEPGAGQSPQFLQFGQDQDGHPELARRAVNVLERPPLREFRWDRTRPGS